jgi:hypothetical protein
MKRMCQTGEYFDKTTVKVSESYEGSYFFNCFWCRPVQYSFEFSRIHCQFSFFNNQSKVFDFRFSEFAFLGFEIQIIFSCFFQYYSFDFFEAINHFGKCQNVVHIDNNQVLFDFLFEYLVHHSLEGCWRITHSKEHDNGFI